MGKKNKVQMPLPPAPVVPEPEPVPVVDFSVWFAIREKKIPSQHMREIIWADFKGQGLGLKETMQTYDAGLARYGIKL